MGAALARMLLAHGQPVTVWNRSSDKAAPLVEEGATLAATASDAIAASPATIVWIESHSHTRALLAADPGVQRCLGYLQKPRRACRASATDA